MIRAATFDQRILKNNSDAKGEAVMPPVFLSAHANSVYFTVAIRSNSMVFFSGQSSAAFMRPSRV